VNKNLSGFAIWWYLSALYFLTNDYLFYVFSVVKNSAVQCRPNVKWSRLVWATLVSFVSGVFCLVLLSRIEHHFTNIAKIHAY